jgi:glyoxylase-like metal-dependent hydrolase (beta-lactamase superfamily II)/rhodanese-related sulfurtransferase
MLFEEVRTGAGCCSYLVACDSTCSAVLVDPEISQVDRLLALAAKAGVRPHYVIDTHTHADHFSASRELARRLGVPAVMHRASVAPYVDLRVDDGETLIAGKLRLRVVHTPGHTEDSMSLVVGDRVLTGDTLLRLATGRTDLPTGDPDALYDSLFDKLLRLDDALAVYPGHNYKGIPPTTIGQEKAENPRLQRRERAAFVEQMRKLDLGMPDHLTEALRTNRTGGKTVAQLLDEAALCIAFMSMEEVRDRLGGRERGLVILDVRERDAYDAGHIPGARHVARGQLEILIDRMLPDPTTPVLTCCEFGKISTLAAATLRTMGFTRTVALDGGIKAWREAGHPLEATPRA